MSPNDTSAADNDALGALVAEVLERIEREGTRALEDACLAHPAQAASLRQRVLALRELGLVQAVASEHAGGRLGDFQLVERIGAGGMGVVYHAVQLSLGRDVALKLIRPEMMHMPGARERFARETTIIARLQHPGIVPIYTVGGADELPYYAMERVPGCTLAEALAELGVASSRRLTGADLARAVRARTSGVDAQAELESSLFAGSWEHTALRILRLVADALEHAHGRGVLHRDLKPSNVMLTPGGRVMLVDFGLSHSDGTESVTRSGERAGSLPYMAPELLQHGMRAVDKRSDVYSLGVTLYQLLTLHLPFRAASEPATLAQILEGRPRPPRALEPRLSWEAETVCLAAMERDPERRYATAADFARDLGHALEHRPIDARRASPWLRTRRWIEAHPAATVAIALALIAPTAIAVTKVLEVRRVAQARDLADDQRNYAQANFERTIRAVDTMLARVGDEKLDHVPGAISLRVELIGDAARLYAELGRERPDRPDLAAFAVHYELRRASLLASVGDTDAALAVARGALPLLEAGIARADFVSRLRHAEVLHFIGLWSEDGIDCAAYFAASLAELADLRRERPGDPNLLRSITNSLAVTVLRTRDSGDRASGEALLAAAEQIAREAAAETAADAATALGFRRVLGSALITRGGWLAREGRHAEALAPLEEALAIRRDALEQSPADEADRSAVSESASACAGSLMYVGRNGEALDLMLLAQREAECNLADFPEVVAFYDRAADVALNLGAAHGRLKHEHESRAATERAIELLGAILDRRPRDGDIHQQLGTSLLNLADSQLVAGEGEQALDTCARSLGHFEAALALKPNHPDFAAWLAPERSTRAKILLALGRTAEAAEALADAPRLAGHLRDRAIHALKRLAIVLERAQAEGDEETIARCDAAARVALERAHERGDLDNDASVAKIRNLLEQR